MMTELWCLAKRPVYVSAAEASRLLGIPAATIRKWRERNKLEVADVDRSGRPLYLLEAVRRVAA